MIDLIGRVVVSGGNSGTGLGIARGVARAGGSVAIWSRRAERNAEAVGAPAVAARTHPRQYHRPRPPGQPRPPQASPRNRPGTPARNRSYVTTRRW